MQNGTSYKAKLKAAIDRLLPACSDLEELLRRLQREGYEIKRGKYISARAPNQERFTRLKTLGVDYTEEALCCLQKQRFFSMFHTSDNTPLHLVFRADVRLPHIAVEGAGFQQLLMRTLCVDGSILHHNDVICANNGRQPVCDHNQGLADS